MQTGGERKRKARIRPGRKKKKAYNEKRWGHLTKLKEGKEQARPYRGREKTPVPGTENEDGLKGPVSSRQKKASFAVGEGESSVPPSRGESRMGGVLGQQKGKHFLCTTVSLEKRVSLPEKARRTLPAKGGGKRGTRRADGKEKKSRVICQFHARKKEGGRTEGGKKRGCRPRRGKGGKG